MSEFIGMEHTHLISVCVFCLLCATHIHCSEYSSRAIKTKIKCKGENSERNLGASREILGRAQNDSVDRAVRSTEIRPRNKRNGEKSAVPVTDEKIYAERLFDKYRTLENEIDLNGFKKMLSSLRLTDVLWAEGDSGAIEGESKEINPLKFQGESGKENEKRDERRKIQKCWPARQLIFGTNGNPESDGFSETHENLLPSEKSKSPTNGKTVQGLDSETFHVREREALPKEMFTEKITALCPLLLYNLVEPSSCHGEDGLDRDERLKSNQFSAWLYASISVIGISLCGLLGVFVIPIMGNAFYNQLLQFLVALAVGTLCGDALLHLLPHAMIPHDDEVHSVVDDHDHDHGHTTTMWKGLAVLLGIVFFFLTEKVLNLGSEWRKKRQRNNKVRGHSHVQIINGNEESDTASEKLCKHKYSSYPYCYPDIKSNKDGHEHSRTGSAVGDGARKCIYRDGKKTGEESSEKWLEESTRLTRSSENESKNEISSSPIDVEKYVEKGNASSAIEEPECDKKDGEYTVIIREHETTHHGHSHAHGHVHSPPESLSSVAWMVVLGDGLHNFTDGMAVGAAFSNNIAGGCSTAVAVFCHELPHELGDFAVLLKAGMSAKQAVFYNMMSSILCFVGMCLGIFVGDDPESTSWVFAVSAGMFLYIGLVDMFPELTTSHSAIESSLCQCSLQFLGLVSGVSIMLVIAYYEDHLLNLFK